MTTNRQGLAALAFAAAVAVGAMPGAPAFAASGELLVPSDGPYAKECGTCHSAFSPALLPAASWRGLMQRLNEHFGDPARVDAATQRAITDYLVANAADRATNGQSRAIMQSLGPNEAPLRITQVPYIARLHSTVLDPLWNGTPRPKTLTECGVCHNDVRSGDFKSKVFHVNDELFRGENPRAR
jgi:hypothetical protein